MGENTYGGLLFVFRQTIQKVLRKVYLQQEFSGLIGESASGICMTVTIWDVGLDIEDRCAIHEIGTSYMQNRTEFLRMFNAQQPDAG